MGAETGVLMEDLVSDKLINSVREGGIQEAAKLLNIIRALYNLEEVVDFKIQGDYVDRIYDFEYPYPGRAYESLVDLIKSQYDQLPVNIQDRADLVRALDIKEKNVLEDLMEMADNDYYPSDPKLISVISSKLNEFS